MHILLCNDDGLAAPGLEVLYRACDGLGRVSVVAPSSERSTTSHAVSLKNPISVREVDQPPFGRAFAVDGMPADCARLGLSTLLSEPVDLVISGVNRGANLGVDIFYSGTVAAAREAAILGVPAIAVSQYVKRDTPVDWDRATAVTAAVLEELAPVATGADSAGVFWNVNLPIVHPDSGSAEVLTVPHSTDRMPLEYSDGEDGDGRSYSYAGAYERRQAGENTDVGVVFRGHVSVTPIRIATTCDRSMGTSIDITFPH